MSLSPVTSGVQGHGGWPAPLSCRIDIWLWLSIALSVGIIPILRLSDAYSKSILRGDGDPGPFGCAVFVVIIFYNTTLLILSTKEQKITKAVELEVQADWQQVGMGNGAGDQVGEVMRVAQMRRTMNFWVLTVCQSGMGALGLYVAARLALLLWAPIPIQKFHNPILGCVELAFSLGEMGILTYTAACCIVHDFEMATYQVASGV